MTTTASDAAVKALALIGPRCILDGMDEELIAQALVEMYETGESDRGCIERPEETGEEALLVSVERLAESLMMRLRRKCLLGISCQAVIKEKLVEMYHQGRGAA